MAPLNLYDITIPTMVNSLTQLNTILSKALELAPTKSLTPESLTTSRLISDMKPFTFQITSACNAAKFTPVRLTDFPDKTFSDDLTTFAELQSRITDTVAFVQQCKREDFEGVETKIIEFYGIKFTGLGYVNKFVLPNFYFHVVTAYAILRKEGIDVGKMDFLGPIKGVELVE